MGASALLAVLVSALLWGLLHGLVAWTWFIGPFWIFFVFAGGWLRWSAQGRWPAFWAAALPHALNNATAMGLTLAFPR